MKNRIKNFVILGLILALSIIFTIMLFEYQENSSLRKEINLTKKQNDSIQNRLFNKNDELIKLLKKAQKEINSIQGSSLSNSKSIDGITIGNKSITIEELINIANQFQKENILLKIKITNDSSAIDRFNKILNQLEKDKVLSKDKKGSITYQQVEKIDSLFNSKTLELNKLKTELKAKNTLLKLIKENYEIDTEIEYGKDVYTAKLLNTKKLDSALWIFPYYKHKIKTNNKGETIIK